MRLRPSLLACLLLAATPVLGAEGPNREARERAGDDGAGAGDRGGDVSTSDLFGFTTGTDVDDRGEKEVSLEAGGAFGKRAGRYRLGTLTGSVGFAPFEGVNLEFGLTGQRVSIRGVPGLDDRSGGGLQGASAELKWQIVKRGEGAPIGLTLVAQPSVGFLDDGGVRGRGVGLEARLALDTALVPDRVFAGLNLIYEAEAFRPRGVLLLNGAGETLDTPFGTDPDERLAAVRRAPLERGSDVGVSGGLAVRALQGVFLGAEARYLRAYDGLALRRFEGHGLFLGPTLYAKLGERVSLSAAWSTQVAGQAAGTPGRLDLDNFSRHQARLKLSVDF